TSKRRSRHRLRQSEQLLLDSATGRVDGGADRRDGERSAFDGRIRQRGIAEFRGDGLDRDPEHLGGELSHPRMGPGADIGGRACRLHPPICRPHPPFPPPHPPPSPHTPPPPPPPH